MPKRKAQGGSRRNKRQKLSSMQRTTMEPIGLNQINTNFSKSKIFNSNFICHFNFLPPTLILAFFEKSRNNGGGLKSNKVLGAHDCSKEPCTQVFQPFFLKKWP